MLTNLFGALRFEEVNWNSAFPNYILSSVGLFMLVETEYVLCQNV